MAPRYKSAFGFPIYNDKPLFFNKKGYTNYLKFYTGLLMKKYYIFFNLPMENMFVRIKFTVFSVISLHLFEMRNHKINFVNIKKKKKKLNKLVPQIKQNFISFSLHHLHLSIWQHNYA